MSIEISDHSGDDGLFADIVDKIATGLEASDSFEIESYIADYPHLEERIRQAAESLRQVFELRPSDFEATHEPRFKSIGEFRIIRELGRGGMGIVYEAEQDSLERRVALKVLPFASLLDERQLKRFRAEARAAAMLKHPNIVSVYSVGSDRTVHYYAMELIDGMSLAEVIDYRSREQTTVPTAAGNATLEERDDSTMKAQLSTTLGR